MKNEEYVYFLTVKEANAIAAKHEDDETWDIWTDPEAQSKGRSNYLAARTMKP